MNNTIRGFLINYTAVDVGVLNPPAGIGKCHLLSNQELEDRYQSVYGELRSKEKKIHFEDKKHTPVLIQLSAIGGVIAYAWHRIKNFFKFNK